jgi:hypothetical protein
MFKKLMLIGMSGITFFSVASAQSNNVYMEMMGPTILGMTINYERIIADNIAIRVGYGSGNKETIKFTENIIIDINTDKITHIPLGAAYLLGSGNHKFELGAGMNMAKGTFDINGAIQSSGSLNIMFGSAGYRYQSGTGGLFLNAKVYYLTSDKIAIRVGADEVKLAIPWFGLGFGWTF